MLLEAVGSLPSPLAKIKCESYRKKNPFYVGGIKCSKTAACRQWKIKSVSNKLNELAIEISRKKYRKKCHQDSSHCLW